MPKGKSQQEKRSSVAQAKLLPKEYKLLRKISRDRRRASLPGWTCSSILRQAFLEYAERLEGEEGSS